ncbi:BatD family protein [Flavobacterium sp. JP2137]|uniref:BatD family protein n=1 Tax=Flavobacterium sp. JP2137 TaxID=3414510 RepID=UPI003D2FC664
MKKNTVIYLLFIGLFGWGLQAQNSVKSSIDTTQIKIGDQFELTVRALLDQGTPVHFPETDRIGPFEVLTSHPIDTLIKDRQYELIKRYSLTQFDSGSYKLPALPVLIDNKQYLTDAYSILVQNVQVDTLKQPMYEIKSISTSGAGISSNWLYLIAIVLCIALGMALYYWIKKRQERNLSEDDLFKTPFEKASKKLDKLAAKKLWVRGETKSYYSDMTDIARVFIEETFNIPAKELTTFELLTIFNQTLNSKKIKIDKRVVQAFKTVFQTADLVKFAKSQPEEFEIISDTDKIQKVINEINIAYPISMETQSEQIRLREKRKKKRKKFRTLVPLSISAALLALTGILYLFNHTEGGSFLKNLSFNSSKRLLNSEWISSTYGNPGIIIETPKVLLRVVDPRVQQTLPPGVESAVQFSSGQITDAVQVMLNLLHFNQEASYTKEEILAHSLKVIAQNLQASQLESKTEVFENAKGVQGAKAAGTFVINNPLTKKEAVIRFELVLLQQGQDAQEIFVFYTDKDAVGAQIAQKILESVQYKTEEKE